MVPLKVFISYSHKDEAFKDNLKDHLSALVRQGKIELWQDRDMEGGTRWDPQIKAALEDADIILLLISSKFMASRYIQDVELQRALERDGEGTVRVIPIILKPTDLAGTAIKQLQALPKDGKAVTQWQDEDSAYLNIVQGIRRVVDSLSRGSASTPKPEPEPEPAVLTPGLSLTQRLTLARRLAELPRPQFEQIVFALDMPPANTPASTLPQGERATQLLAWATSEIGCGLEALHAVLEAVVKS